MIAVDRSGPAYETPLGDRRERAVLCRRCHRRETWTLRGICETCEPIEGEPIEGEPIEGEPIEGDR